MYETIFQINKIIYHFHESQWLEKLIEAEWRIYVSVNYAITGSDNGLSPGRHQGIIWTNAGILLIGPLGTNISEISIEILTFSFKKMHLELSSGKGHPFCLGLNVLRNKLRSYSVKNQLKHFHHRSIMYPVFLTDTFCSVSHKTGMSLVVFYLWLVDSPDKERVL